MVRTLMWVISLMSVALWVGALASQAGEPAGELLLISIRVYDVVGEGDEQRKKVLAEPTIATVSDQPFTMRAGGTVKPKSFGDDLEIGTLVTGKLERIADGGVRMALTIGLSSTVGQAGDEETDLVKTEAIELRTILMAGELKRLKCASNRWCEVRVEPAS